MEEPMISLEEFLSEFEAMIGVCFDCRIARSGTRFMLAFENGQKFTLSVEKKS